MTDYLDPRDTIDRKVEQELFKSDLAIFSANKPARMLVIRDRPGLGKSTLLRRLQYNCRYEIRPAIPVCIVDLNQLADSSPFAFIEKIVEGLKIDDRFPKFTPLNSARGAKNFGPFDTSAADVRGKVTIEGQIKGGTVGGINIQEAAVVNLTRDSFTDIQEQIARKKCVEAFFDDLRVICADQSIVMLLDHWEKCNYDLREWIRETFLGQHCFHRDKNMRPNKLAIVIAGNAYDLVKEKFGLRDKEFITLFNDEQEHNETVLSIESLSKWDSEHVSLFLKLQGYEKADDFDVDYLRERLAKGNTLEEILNAYRSIHPGKS